MLLKKLQSSINLPNSEIVVDILRFNAYNLTVDLEKSIDKLCATIYEKLYSVELRNYI